MRLAFNVQTLSRLHLEACGYVLKFKETDLPKLDNITGLLSLFFTVLEDRVACCRVLSSAFCIMSCWS